MRRIHIFLFTLTASLGLLIILLAASLYLAATTPASYQSGTGSTSYPTWMQQMWRGMGMGGMMGGTSSSTPQTTTPQATTPSFLWVIPAALIGLVIIGAIGSIFYLAFPEIKPTRKLQDPSKSETVSDVLPRDPIAQTVSPSARLRPYESVAKTMTPEERKVLDVLIAHGGSYLQKYIRKDAGLSRLQTHRIIARFAERGIVTLKQSGNTNDVVLSDWLKDSNTQNQA